MKKFLAIDTGSKYLTVIVFNEQPYVTYLPDCLMNHSSVLMDAIEETFQKAGITAKDCDFFACCVGAGSFTGIRIGIACIKGFATAFNKPTVGVTSFECMAYTKQGTLYPVVDALHHKYYCCGFDEEKKVIKEPCFITEEEVLALKEQGTICSYEPLSVPSELCDMQEGLLKAVLAKGEKEEYGDLTALYIRKSQAEESLK